MLRITLLFGKGTKFVIDLSCHIGLNLAFSLLFYYLLAFAMTLTIV